MPPAVSGLSRLQRAFFEGTADAHGNVPALPAGPWASSLRQLGASYDVLAASGGMLAAATQLQELHLMGGNFTDPQHAFWAECVPHLPMLRLLHFYSDMGEFLANSHILFQLADLARGRPELDMQHSPLQTVAFHFLIQ